MAYLNLLSLACVVPLGIESKLSNGLSVVNGDTLSSLGDPGSYRYIPNLFIKPFPPQHRQTNRFILFHWQRREGSSHRSACEQEVWTVSNV
mmetsp:Transcript_36149/g.86173  ORF Transcript_36149/g.86173 Transcript_36149/m.86173 type:complete len:91 (+) Transcript_36149:277-549(+)